MNGRTTLLMVLTGAIMLAGCGSLVEYEAPGASLPTDAIEAAGYERIGQETTMDQIDWGYAGYNTLRLYTERYTYRASRDSGPAIFGAVITPTYRNSQLPENPVLVDVRATMVDVAEDAINGSVSVHERTMAVENVTGADGDEEPRYTRTVQKYRATMETAEGEAIDAFLIIGETLGQRGTALTVSLYPQDWAGEATSMRLIRAVAVED